MSAPAQAVPADRSRAAHTTDEQVSGEPSSHQGDPYEIGSGPEFGSSEPKCKSHEQIRASGANASQPGGGECKHSNWR